jgi:hypothetical protein
MHHRASITVNQNLGRLAIWFALLKLNQKTFADQTLRLHEDAVG